MIVKLTDDWDYPMSSVETLRFMKGTKVDVLEAPTIEFAEDVLRSKGIPVDDEKPPHPEHPDKPVKPDQLPEPPSGGVKPPSIGDIKPPEKPVLPRPKEAVKNNKKK